MVFSSMKLLKRGLSTVLWAPPSGNGYFRNDVCVLLRLADCAKSWRKNKVRCWDPTVINLVLKLSQSTWKQILKIYILKFHQWGRNLAKSDGQKKEGKMEKKVKKKKSKTYVRSPRWGLKAEQENKKQEKRKQISKKFNGSSVVSGSLNIWRGLKEPRFE